MDSLSQLLRTSLPGHMSREAGLFPIVALQEMGVANISRLDVIWEPITSHLSQVLPYVQGTVLSDSMFLLHLWKLQGFIMQGVENSPPPTRIYRKINIKAKSSKMLYTLVHVQLLSRTISFIVLYSCRPVPMETPASGHSRQSHLPS